MSDSPPPGANRPRTGAKVPPVVVVLVTSGAGVGLEAALESLDSQDYRELVTLVVDADSDHDPTARVAAVLPDGYVQTAPSGAGFAEAANLGVASVEGARFVLFCRDTVAFESDAVRQMVEESFRSDAAVIGPKLVRSDEPRRLASVGLNVDRFGVESPRVDPGEFDQEQHDGVEDVFSLSPSALLVRCEVLDEVGHFDEAMVDHGEVLDLCWRVQVAGHRVIVAPAAKVRCSSGIPSEQFEPVESGEPGESAGPGESPDAVDDDPHSAAGRARLRGRQIRSARPTAQLSGAELRERGLYRRHRLRTMLGSYRLRTLVWLLPLLALYDLVEAIVSLVTGRRARAREVVSAWKWNLANRATARGRRRQLSEVRRLSDFGIRRMQEPGSTRLLRFLRLRFGLSAADRGVTDLRGTVAEAVRVRLHPDTLAVFGFAAFVVLFGSRRLLTGTLPAVGEFVPFGASASELFSLWSSGFRDIGVGSASAPPTAFGLFGLLGMLPGVSLSALQRFLLVATLALGPIAAWRLARRVGSRRARLAVLLVHIAVPLPYNALALGDWSALMAWAVAPLILGRLIDASGIAPLAVPRSPRRTLVGLGIIVTIASTISPMVLVLTLVTGLALALGALLHGSTDGLAHVLGTTIGAVLFAIVAHMPWSLDVLASADGWATIAGVDPRTGTGDGFARLMRFQTGPHGAGVLLIGLLVAAALALLIGRRWRLAVAIRLWTVAVVFWALAGLADASVFPFSAPSGTTLLAPAAAAIALSVGLSVATVGDDLRSYRFGWRQFLSFVSPAALLLAVVPILWSAFDGGWQAPRSGFSSSFSFLDSEAAERDSDFRVLWLGHPEVLPGDGWRLTEELSYLTTVNTSPSLSERWPSAETDSDTQLRDAVLASRDGDAGRMGESLAGFGIEYVVVVEANAPVPRGTIVEPAPVWVGESLSRQLDLVELKINDAVQVFRNEASRGFNRSEARSLGMDAAAGSGLRRAFQWAQIALWGVALAIGVPLWVRRRRQTLMAIARGDERAMAPDWYRDRADSDDDQQVIDLRDPVSATGATASGASALDDEASGEIDLRPHEIRPGYTKSQRQTGGGVTVGDRVGPDDGSAEVSS